jgi:HAMP domain-containing protein
VNFNVVIEWVKTNVFIVVFVILMIAAPLAMFFVSSSMSQGVRSRVSQRAQKISELQRLEKGDITTPDGQSVQGVLNEKFLQRYMQVANIMNDDAVEVQRAALDHNRKNRNVVMKGVFPEMPTAKRDVLPQQFHEALAAAYESMLAEINAGIPPTLESMRDELTRARHQFITQDLRKTTTDELTADEQKQLSEKLSLIRMARYEEAADKIGLYVSIDQLGVPGFDRTRQPSVGELFRWQWQFWITEDVLKALRKANNSDPVIRAPVKHVLRVSVRDLPVSAEDESSSGDPGQFGAGGGFGGGAQGLDSPQGEESTAPPTGTAPNPKAPAPRDYSNSPLTGRVTNPLYDVIHVGIDLVVEAGRLPHVMDELARYNFITVTAMELNPADPFEAAHGGYFYGIEPVTNVHLELETIWLREWTKEFMPKSIKKELGVPDETRAADQA